MSLVQRTTALRGFGNISGRSRATDLRENLSKHANILPCRNDENPTGWRVFAARWSPPPPPTGWLSTPTLD